MATRVTSGLQREAHDHKRDEDQVSHSQNVGDTQAGRLRWRLILAAVFWEIILHDSLPVISAAGAAYASAS